MPFGAWKCLRSGQKQKLVALPVINMYGDSSSDEDDDQAPTGSAECQKLLRSADDSDPRILMEEVDVEGLKMQCQERIKLIREDLRDPSLSADERKINAINLSTLNAILTNIRFDEKIKLGSLQNSQYADAVILQKQVVCNFAGQKEYGVLMKPVLQGQQSSVFDGAEVGNDEQAVAKSILKPSARSLNNNTCNEAALA
jgi:hypothetical protein